MTVPTSSRDARLRTIDVALLLLVCALLYAPGVFGGRPLSIHEARVPELAREMVLGQSDWILPESGGRPWLERPPLPHWFTAGSMMLFGKLDAAWVVRLPAALVATAMVLAGAWMATRWFGRSIGLVSGLVLASSYEFYQYATLAEDDIYLAGVVIACVALFVKHEWPTTPPAAIASNWARTLFGGRPWGTVLLFVMLGLTNLAKGPMVGALPVLAAFGIFLASTRDVRRIRHYAWVWGWLVFALVAAAWPAWALYRYPDILDNWRYDYLGQVDGKPAAAAHEWDESSWYYLAMLPMSLAPWTWATVIGFATTARRAWRERGSPERFLWCWSCAGILILSLPARKHHHYLVPMIAPFAIVSVFGLIWTAGRLLAHGTRDDRSRQPWFGLLIIGLPGAIAIAIVSQKVPAVAHASVVLIAGWLASVALYYHGLSRDRPAWLLAAVLAGTIISAGWIQFAVAGRDPATLAEGAFCRETLATVPSDAPIYINADIDSLNFFRLQFALGPRGRLLHNLSYLRDRDLDEPVDYVIAQAKDQEALADLGRVEPIAQVEALRRGASVAGNRFMLFKLMPAAGLERYPRAARIGVLQAMSRKPGPWLGDRPAAKTGISPRPSQDSSLRSAGHTAD